MRAVTCPHCGAPFKDPIPFYKKSVNCQYCKALIQLDDSDEQLTFSPATFERFSKKRGFAFDPVSGIVKLGNQKVVVSCNGTVFGKEPLRSRVERWVYESNTVADETTSEK